MGERWKDRLKDSNVPAEPKPIPHDDYEMLDPGTYMTGAWWKACLLGLAVYAVGAAFVGLWSLTKFEFLLYLIFFCIFAGSMPILGGLAGLFRQVFGEKALKVSVVASVILIILACISFFILVAKGVIR